MLQLEEKMHKLGIDRALSEYPMPVKSEAFGISVRIRARCFGMAHVDGQVFLGFCTTHKKYYLDIIHTNEDIRCPICDKKWLDDLKHV